MKNSQNIPSYEINLAELFKVIWDGKIKIAIITLIIFSIISVHSKYKPKHPNLINASLAISPTTDLEFINFSPIYYSYLHDNTFDLTPININQPVRILIMEKFIQELMDYEELIKTLKDNESIKKKLSHLSIKDKEKKLYDYIKNFKIEKQDTIFPKYILKFSLEGINEEIREILDQTIKLALINLKNSIFLELNNNFQRNKNSVIKANLSRLNYLSEQSLIAKELKISVGNMYNINLSESYNKPYNSSSSLEQNNVLNVNRSAISDNSAYYLKGYKAIDMEIKFLKNKKYLELENIEERIKSLEKKDIKWVNFNINLLNTNIQDRNKIVNPLLSAVFGLLIGVIYILIFNKFQSFRVFKKK